MNDPIEPIRTHLAKIDHLLSAAGRDARREGVDEITGTHVIRAILRDAGTHTVVNEQVRRVLERAFGIAKDSPEETLVSPPEKGFAESGLVLLVASGALKTLQYHPTVVDCIEAGASFALDDAPAAHKRLLSCLLRSDTQARDALRNVGEDADQIAAQLEI